jgi:hypothetical protein
MWNLNFPPKHMKEQAAWRLELVKQKSSECFNKMECFCGCPVDSLIYQPDACGEKNKCFPKQMSKKEWNTFKNNSYANR